MKRTAAVLVLALASPASAKEAPKVPTPGPEAVLSTLRRGHPRVILTAGDLTRLRAAVKTDPTLKAWHAQLEKDARKILNEPPSKYEIPDGLRLLATSRQVLGRVSTLALAHQLGGDAAFAERAWIELEAAANFKDWNPKHFLDVAEMTFAFGIGYDWLHGYWSAARRSALKDAILKHGLTPALDVYRGKLRSGWWAKAEHNWNQVCNGGIALGALAVADEAPEIAREILAAGLQSIQLAMVHFAPDGGWNEGPGYWDYATKYNVAYLAGLESALGSDFGLSAIPGFSEAGTFPIHMSGTTGHSFNYADAHAGEFRPPQLFWMARKFQRPEYAFFEARQAKPTAFDLIWYTPPPATATDAPLDRHFRVVEVAAMRGAWGDKEASFVGFKAGDNKANHSNLDLGSFIFEALDRRWAVDLGSDNYNLPGYFGGQRWNYYRMRAEGHNTLVVKPDAAPDQDPKAGVAISAFQSKPARAHAIADLTPAYAKRAKSVRRGIALLDRRNLLVQDEIAADPGAELWWFMHTPATVELSPDGRAAKLALRGRVLEARLLSPPGAKFSVMDAAPLPSTPKMAKQDANKGVRKLAVRTAASGSRTSIAVWLAPATDKGAAPPPARLTPLGDWGRL